MAVLEKIIHYIDINYIQKFVTEYSKQMENNLKMVCFNALNEKEKDLFCYNFELFKNSGRKYYLKKFKIFPSSKTVSQNDGKLFPQKNI